MSHQKAEQEVLDEKLRSALAEARTKTRQALERNSSDARTLERSLWAAAEATEYASLVYSLRHNVEDRNTSHSTPNRRKTIDPSHLVEEARQSLAYFEHQTDHDKESVVEGYRTLRRAADDLRTAYLYTAKSGTAESKPDKT